MTLRHALFTRCIVGCLLGGAVLTPVWADLPPTLRVVSESKAVRAAPEAILGP